MLERGQVNEGAELGLLLIEHFTKTNTPPTDETIRAFWQNVKIINPYVINEPYHVGIISDIFQKFPKAQTPAKKQFIQAAVKYALGVLCIWLILNS